MTEQFLLVIPECGLHVRDRDVDAGLLFDQRLSLFHRLLLEVALKVGARQCNAVVPELHPGFRGAAQGRLFLVPALAIPSLELLGKIQRDVRVGDDQLQILHAQPGNVVAMLPRHRLALSHEGLAVFHLRVLVQIHFCDQCLDERLVVRRLEVRLVDERVSENPVPCPAEPEVRRQCGIVSVQVVDERTDLRTEHHPPGYFLLCGAFYFERLPFVVQPLVRSKQSIPLPDSLPFVE